MTTFIISMVVYVMAIFAISLIVKNAKKNKTDKGEKDSSLEEKIVAANKQLDEVCQFALEYANDAKAQLYTVQLATSFQSAAALTRQTGEWKLSEVMAEVKKLAEAANLAEKRSLQERALKLLNGHRVNHDTYSAIIDGIENGQCDAIKLMISSIEESSKQKNSSSKKNSSSEESAATA